MERIKEKTFKPFSLSIELTDHCNLRCSMCLQSHATRIHDPNLPKKFIDFELVRKVVNELVQKNCKIKSLTPFWMGEALVHPQFSEILDFIFAENKKSDLFNDFVINTNGVLFDANISRKFLEYASFISKYHPEKNIFITFSLDFVTPRVFKKVKGGDESLARKILSNIDYLIKTREELGLKKPSIIYKLVVQNANQHEVTDFISFWSRKLDYYGVKYELVDSTWALSGKDAICINKLYGAWDAKSEEEAALHERILTRIGFYSSDYGGKLAALPDKAATFRRPCFQLWNQLLITSNGIITPCCRDTKLELAIGNANDNSLMDIGQTQKLIEMRLWQIKGEWNRLPLCAQCADPQGGNLSDEQVIQYLAVSGNKEERDFYLKRINDETKLQKEEAKPAYGIKKLLSSLDNFQLKIYDYYIHRDNPDSFISARKVGNLEFYRNNSAALEVTYMFSGPSQWLLLDYIPKIEDWSQYNSVHILLKGDTKGGPVIFSVLEKDGDEWTFLVENAFDRNAWKEFVLPFEKFSQPDWVAKGDRRRTFDKVTGYRIIFDRHASAAGQKKTVLVGNIWLSKDIGAYNRSGEIVKRKTGNLCICLVSREYPPDTCWGGIGTYTYRLARGLAAAGHAVHVVCQGLIVDRDYEEEGVYVHRVSHKSCFPLKGKFREFGLRWEYSQSVYEKIRGLIKKHPIDVVEAPNLSGEGFIYSLHKRVPLVTRLHTHFSEVAHFLDWKMTMDRRLSCWFENAAILRSDIITCSTQAHARLVSGIIGISQAKIKIIPLGVEIPHLNGDIAVNNPPIVLFVGRIEKRKGIHILMQAIPSVLKEIPGVKFLIAGRDSYITEEEVSFSGPQHLSYQQQLIKMLPVECKGQVEFLGHVSGDQLKRLYSACDILVAPSLYESFGQIYIEAMSYGKPVIGCGVGGVPEVINDGQTGILVPPGDAERLSSAIVGILSDRIALRQMGKAAREHIEQSFSLEKMVTHTASVYEEALV
ncbi:MAG: glycosyltransferase [Candidatus Omnitrophota bacterium]